MSTVSTNLPRSPDSVGTARRLVNRHTLSLGLQQREDAVLMVSELVTNALVHGVGAIALRIDAEAGTVRIEVADDWGVLDSNTTVWCRLRQNEE